MNAPEPPVLGKAQYEALSEFRFQLRRFLRFSEDAARAEGLTPLQYQLLLHVRGFPGRDWATVGELSLRLQTQQHGVVALLTRRFREREWKSPRARQQADSAGSNADR